jgi:hypothetical protein
MSNVIDHKVIFNSLTLPIKANMLNTLYHSGGNPIWIEVENPIYKPCVSVRRVACQSSDSSITVTRAIALMR